MQKKNGVIIIEGHVQGLANTRALGKEGIPVIVIDKGACIASASIYCKAFYKCPDYKTDAFVDFLLELGSKKNLYNWTLLPSNDHAVYSISRNLDRIRTIYKTTIPELCIINRIYNKAELLKIASKVGVPFPKTFYFESIEDVELLTVEYPLLTKGKQGLDFYKILGKKAFLSNDKVELEFQLRQIANAFPLINTFTQELIPFNGRNKTISVAAFCINGEIKAHWMGAKLREHPLQFGTATFTESIYEKACLLSAKALLEDLNYTGVCEVEFLRDPRDNQFKLIEINARTWLWVGHAIANGINFPLIIYNFLNNINTEYHSDYQIGLKWRNPFSDFIFNLIGIIKGNYSINLIRIQNKGKVINALWDKNDKKPWFKYAFLMLNFIKYR
jgi:D-aspartate ligase